MWKFANHLAIAGLFVISQAASADDQAPQKPIAKTPAALNFKVQSLEGKEVNLAQYQGKVVLVVNVASKCGLTPQYKALEALYQKYNGQGLVILGFPCNQFNGQEPGTAEEIRTFCTSKYNVTFPLMAKVKVNGAGACDLYKHLKALDAKPKGPGEITWNFEKFVIGRNGEVVARFQPRTTPDATDLISVIESELGKR
ncbi:MAG: glutathione peroxidase [Thermoguttaceae bacterium]